MPSPLLVSVLDVDVLAPKLGQFLCEAFLSKGMRCIQLCYRCLCTQPYPAMSASPSRMIDLAKAYSVELDTSKASLLLALAALAGYFVYRYRCSTFPHSDRTAGSLAAKSRSNIGLKPSKDRGLGGMCYSLRYDFSSQNLNIQNGNPSSLRIQISNRACNLWTRSRHCRIGTGKRDRTSQSKFALRSSRSDGKPFSTTMGLRNMPWNQWIEVCRTLPP